MLAGWSRWLVPEASVNANTSKWPTGIIMGPPRPLQNRSQFIPSVHPFSVNLSPGIVPGCVRSLSLCTAQPCQQAAPSQLSCFVQLRGEGGGEKRENGRREEAGTLFILASRAIKRKVDDVLPRFPFPATIQPQATRTMYGPETKQSFAFLTSTSLQIGHLSSPPQGLSWFHSS